MRCWRTKRHPIHWAWKKSRHKQTSPTRTFTQNMKQLVTTHRLVKSFLGHLKSWSRTWSREGSSRNPTSHTPSFTSKPQQVVLQPKKMVQSAKEIQRAVQKMLKGFSKKNRCVKVKLFVFVCNLMFNKKAKNCFLSIFFFQFLFYWNIVLSNKLLSNIVDFFYCFSKNFWNFFIRSK